MSNWVTPSVDDVLSEFTPSELATITTLMGGMPLDNTSKLAVILARTVAEIRGYIKSGTYAVDTTSSSTLPASMVTDAVAITRWRLLVSAPQLKQLQTQERRDAMMASILKLQAVAAQNFTPDDPETSNVQTAGMWNSENKIIMRTHPPPPPATQWTPQIDSYANPNAPQDQVAIATLMTSGTLIVGVNYEIFTYVLGDDFTNVGATSNASSVVFTAIGTTPAIWTNGSSVGRIS